MEKPVFEKATAGEKVAVYLEKWRIALIVILAAAVVAVAGYAIATWVHSSKDKSGLEKVDKIEFNLIADSDKLSDEEAAARKNDALKALEPLVSDSCVTGVRANLLAADIEASMKNYENAANYYLAAAKVDSKVYTAPIAYFNAAACYDNLGKAEEAAKYYEKAAEFEEFVQAPRAYFNAGREKEALKDVEGAKKAYEKINEKFAESQFAGLAKSRLIALDSNK